MAKGKSQQKGAKTAPLMTKAEKKKAKHAKNIKVS